MIGKKSDGELRTNQRAFIAVLMCLFSRDIRLLGYDLAAWSHKQHFSPMMKIRSVVSSGNPVLTTDDLTDKQESFTVSEIRNFCNQVS